MGIGDEEQPDIDFVNWDELYARTTGDEPIIEGLAFRGRWTALSSPAKAGKSTLLLALAVEATRQGFVVAYLDAEMGRADTLDRVEDWMSLKPVDLVNLHYTDLPPKLDHPTGAQTLWKAVRRLKPDLVVVDGLNGVVNGAENDDTTWRDMYEYGIRPLKQMGVAVISADNSGHGDPNRPRGSSVKLDKADAAISIKRTDTGVKLTATHRRSSSYPQEQEYLVSDAHEGDPAMTVTRVGAGSQAPHGTGRMVKILDELDVPLDAGKRIVRRILKEAGHEVPRDTELLGMLQWRKQNTNPFRPVPPVPGTAGTAQAIPKSLVPKTGTTSTKPQRVEVVPTGGDLGTPPVSTGSQNLVPETPEKQNGEPSVPTVEDALG